MRVAAGPLSGRERFMPIVQIDLLEGRDTERKHRLIRLVTEAVCEALEARPESVRVILREMDGDHYGVAGVPASARAARS
ncbi:MAG: 2-hydroxymuconate tautomerase [Candidatus Velamenicoccus archaeovorus]